MAGFDPFGDLLQAEQMIAQDKFKRQQYDDLMQRQMAQDAIASEDRMMQQQAYAAIPNQISAQMDANAANVQVPLRPDPVDNQKAITDALIANPNNPNMLQIAGQYNKLLSPSTGGGVTYKNATRDDGTTGIFAIKPTGEFIDTGLNAEKKTSTGAMSPEDAMSFAQQIVNGNLDINTLPKRGSVRQDIISKIYQIQPNFNIVEAEANAKYTKDASNLRSVGLIAGVEPLFENLTLMGNKLDNTGIPIWNKIKNAAGEATGDPDIVAFNNARDDFVAEAERILLGSGVLSDSKYNRALGNLNSAQSPEQMQAAIDQIRKVIVAREEALKESPYQQPTGQPAETQPTGGIKFLGFE